MKDYDQKKITKFSNFTFKKFIIVFIICLIFVTMYVIKNRLSFMGTWDMVLLFIYSPIIIILSVSADLLFSKKINLSIYTLVIPIAIIFGGVCGNFISKYQADLSKEKAKPIIEAIEKFKKENNRYPDNLSELVPIYITAIPDSMMGWFNIPYHYNIQKDGKYNLSFQ